MNAARRDLLAVVEFFAHTGLKTVYERLGYSVVSEFTVRKAIAAVRKRKPDVIVADFFYQPDFRDRVSNLESLLATVQGDQAVKVLVYYDAAHQHALDRVRQRFNIDGALTLPVKTTDIEAVLANWLARPAADNPLDRSS
jgi:DNA-binding NarL/FixJ family response regulator